MSEIHLRRKHAIGLKQGKVAVQKVADDLAEEYGIESTWQGDILRMNRSGLEGEVRLTRSDVKFDAKVGPQLLAFRARIEEHLNETFDRYFT